MLFIEAIRNSIKTCDLFVWIIISFLTVVCGCAVWFIFLQYRKKKMSVALDGEIMEVLSNEKLSDINKLNRLSESTALINNCWRYYRREKKEENKKKREKEDKKERKCMYKWKPAYAEGPIYILIGIFFVTQVFILCKWINF